MWDLTRCSLPNNCFESRDCLCQDSTAGVDVRICEIASSAAVFDGV